MEQVILQRLGSKYLLNLEFGKAIDTLQQGLVAARENKDRQGEGFILLSLGQAYSTSYWNNDNPNKDDVKATQYIEQSLLIAREQKIQILEANALISLANLKFSSGELKKSVSLAKEGIGIVRDLKNNDQWKNLSIFLELSLLQRLDLSYADLGDTENQIKNLNDYLEIAQQLNNEKMEGKTFYDIAYVYLAKSEFSIAIDYLGRSLKIAQKINSTQLKINSFMGLGISYLSIGDFDKGLEYYQKALLALRASDAKDFADSLEIPFHTASGLSRSSSRGINRSLERISEKRDYKHTLEVMLISGIADISLYKDSDKNNYSIEQAKKNINQAIDYYYQSLEIAHKFHLSLEDLDVYSGLASAYMGLGNYRKSVEYYEKALNFDRKSMSNFRRFDRLRAANVIVALARVQAIMGNHKKAISLARRALSINQEDFLTHQQLIKGDASRTTILMEFGFILLQAGQFSEAEKVLLEAIRGNEAIRVGLGSKDSFKTSFFDIVREPFSLLEYIYSKKHKLEKALEITEQSRARALTDLLSQRISTTSVHHQFTPFTVEQIRQIARSLNATLVTYSVAADPLERQSFIPSSILHIWVVKPTGKIDFREVNLKPFLKQNVLLGQFIASSRESMGVRGLPSRATLIAKSPLGTQPSSALQKQRLQQLHQMLIDPIADLLPNDPNDRVIFIPQGSLFLVPFPALQDANGKYLIEKHTILTAPSIQVLDQTHQLQQQRNSERFPEALVVGNPTMPAVTLYPGEAPQQLPSLPGAAIEATSIAPLLHTQAITGNQGTKATIVQKMPNARIIHLATHGILDDLRGIGSAIALAPDPGKPPQDELGRANGLLTAEEILDMKLNAELVVLSACDTGRGRITGDGVIGLSRSFISAGVPSIIVSLWSIPDAPTAELMTEFYKNWQGKKLDKAQALRQAMLTTMKTHPNPRDWAAFTLIGEAK